MSSSPETSTRTTGAHRAHREARDRAAARTLAQRPPARYEPYLDGLFTYCLSVLCDHDTATAALGDVLALAERRGARVPETAGDRRAWLYALARWACLRKLAEAKQKRQGTHAVGRSEVEEPALSEEVREQRRRELALLAWPEAAGTTPEQREALELAVRHRLAAHEVAAVLGMDLATARELLAAAACEVERTRAALAVVETGSCPSVARLTGDHQLVLSSALRRELVRHVDDCPHCRRTAERAVPGSWPGASVTPAELPVLEAPRAALHVAMAHLPRARGAAAPRFDRRGFPMDPKDRAARRDRLRARAVTTTVVATVIAAPVLALWAAYRGTPTGEGADGRAATASEQHGPDALEGAVASGGYENTGNAGDEPAARQERQKRCLRRGHQRHRRRSEGRRAARRLGRQQQRHHAHHPHRVRLGPGPLVRDHRGALALPQPVLGNPGTGRIVDDQGVRRPSARALRPLDRARGRLTGRGHRLDRGLRHRTRPDRPRQPHTPHRSRRPALVEPGSDAHEHGTDRPHAQRPAAHVRRPDPDTDRDGLVLRRPGGSTPPPEDGDPSSS